MSQAISKGLSRRSLLKTMGAAAGLAGTGTFVSISRGAAADMYKVSLQLGWLASNGILGEIAADKLGYFAEEGLELEVVAGGPNIDGVASVASAGRRLASAVESVLRPARSKRIVRRWQDWTGGAATLEGDGRTFEALVAEQSSQATLASEANEPSRLD